jgi:dihydroxy-acid dehydratase
MAKPQVGISSMWYEGNPCNMHLLSLAEDVKRGVVRTAQLVERVAALGRLSHAHT